MNNFRIQQWGFLHTSLAFQLYLCGLSTGLFRSSEIWIQASKRYFNNFWLTGHGLESRNKRAVLPRLVSFLSSYNKEDEREEKEQDSLTRIIPLWMRLVSRIWRKMMSGRLVSRPSQLSKQESFVLMFIWPWIILIYIVGVTFFQDLMKQIFESWD